MSVTLNPTHVPNQASVGANAPAHLGNQPVQMGAGERVRRALSDIGTTVGNFLKGIATRFENWQEGRAVASATAKATKAADHLVDAMMGGAFGPNASNDVNALMKNSARADTNHPEALAETLLSSKLAGLPMTERSKACFADINGLTNTMKAASNKELDAVANLHESLARVGLSNGTFDVQEAKTVRNSGIDAFAAVAKGVVTNQRLTDLRALTNGIFQIDDGGVISGTTTNKVLPNFIAQESSGKSVIDGSQGATYTPSAFIEGMGRKRIADNANGTKSSFKDVAGVKLFEKAGADFHRMNIVFDHGGGQTYNTRLKGDSSEIPTRLATSVGQLEQLAGSKTAASVLSSILHQTDLREMVHIFRTNDDKTVDLNPLKKGYSHAEVKDGQGNTHGVDNPVQIGEAVVTVSRAGNDFKVDVSWDYLGAKLTDETLQGLPVDHNYTDSGASTPEERAFVPNCLRVQMTGSFTVSGNDARNGQLTVQPNAVFTHVFSGTLDMPA